MSIIHDFNSINRKLNRLEQKAEADKKNEPVPTPVGWPYGPTMAPVNPMIPASHPGYVRD